MAIHHIRSTYCIICHNIWVTWYPEIHNKTQFIYLEHSRFGICPVNYCLRYKDHNRNCNKDNISLSCTLEHQKRQFTQNIHKSKRLCRAFAQTIVVFFTYILRQIIIIKNQKYKTWVNTIHPHHCTKYIMRAVSRAQCSLTLQYKTFMYTQTDTNTHTHSRTCRTDAGGDGARLRSTAQHTQHNSWVSFVRF